MSEWPARDTVDGINQATPLTLLGLGIGLVCVSWIFAELMEFRPNYKRYRLIFNQILNKASSFDRFSTKEQSKQKEKVPAAMPPTRRRARLRIKILVGHRPSFWAYLVPLKCHIIKKSIFEPEVLWFFMIFILFPIVTLVWP